MSEELSCENNQRSWLNKLVHLFTGDLKDRKELLEQLREAHENKLLDTEALTIIEGAIEASEMQVRDVMIPRSKMVCIKTQQQPESFLPKMIESGHSRFPVIGENQDEVLGILIAKDLLPLLLNKQHKLDLSKNLRPAIFIPESKRLNILLKEFRTSRYHMAIVADEYGGVAGLVTIEDVLEQIVGDIEDETDVKEDAPIKQLGANDFIVQALTPIEDFNDHFSSQFSDEEFDTIGGLVMQSFGHLPKCGEQTTLDQFTFKVIKSDNRRIILLKVTF